ncbi:MAG: hypothetical protein FWG90_06820 [Oscillospiraceae bacterium]|nr:hypothetical protein [Oscillospiraceae bacterium]
MKIMRIIVLCLVGLFCLTGCGGGGVEADLPNVSIFESARGSIETTMSEAETEKETTATTIIVDGQTYYDGMELLYNNWKGLTMKTASYKAARAYLRSDRDELAGYLLEPDSVNDLYIFDSRPNIFDTLTYMSVAYATIFSETYVHIGYVLASESNDTLTYLEVYLVKIEDEWKVEEIGLQG